MSATIIINGDIPTPDELAERMRDISENNDREFRHMSIVATFSVDERMKSDKDFATFVQLSLGKYVNCDWGDTCEEDKKTNEDALKNGERLLAVYKFPKTGEAIWIITEWDRSVTTILFPSEY